MQERYTASTLPPLGPSGRSLAAKLFTPGVRDGWKRTYFTSLHATLLVCVGTNLRPFKSQWNGPLAGTSQFRPPYIAHTPTTTARITIHATTIHRFGVEFTGRSRVHCVTTAQLHTTAGLAHC